MNAKKQHADWVASVYTSSIVSKVTIKCSRKPFRFLESVQKWILENTRISSNINNVVKWTEHDQEVEGIIQWRDESIAAMFENCKLSIENGNLLKKTYFFHAMPLVVCKAKLLDCLCSYHMNAYKVVMEIARLCQKWHFPTTFKCPCNCNFCSISGCDHGKNPLNGICKKFTCSRCKNVKCSVEWDKKMKTTWYISYLQKRKGGGNV